MGILGMNMKDVPPQQPAGVGEHKLRIRKWTEKEASTGRPMVAIMFISTTEPNASPVFHNLLGPMKDDDKEVVEGWERQAANFCAAFDLDGDSPTLAQDAVGAEGFVMIKHESSEEYGLQPRISRFVLPQ